MELHSQQEDEESSSAYHFKSSLSKEMFFQKFLHPQPPQPSTWLLLARTEAYGYSELRQAGKAKSREILIDLTEFLSWDGVYTTPNKFRFCERKGKNSLVGRQL